MKPTGSEKIVYSGKMFEVIKQSMNVGDKIVEFETARRSPGARLIIIKEEKILLTKEFRTELNGYDYRLPGGKVFDSLKEFKSALQKGGDMQKYALRAAEKECREETGLIPISIRNYTTSKAGATIEWDLFYFIVDKFKEDDHGQKLETGEIIHPEWRTFREAEEMCIEGKIHEDRSVGILLRFLKDENA